MKMPSAVQVVAAIGFLLAGWLLCEVTHAQTNHDTDMQTFLTVSEPVKNWAETFAIVIGGVWTIWRFRLRREGKPALEIALTHTTISEPDGRFLAYFDVTLTNKSTLQLLAKKRTPKKPAFSEGNDVLQHSCSLLLRHVATRSPLGTQIRWFADPDAKSPLPTDIVANLLDEYEHEIEGKSDFWMEPSECYHLSVGVILKSGIYLAMVTFVGEHGDEFWRRQFIIRIPEQNAQTSEEARVFSLESARPSGVEP